MRTRRLDSNWDLTWGNGQGDFLTDIDALRQIIRQHLLLFEAEWWMDTGDGLPLFQQILGYKGQNKGMVDQIVAARIQDLTPYVTGIDYYSSDYDPNARVYSYTCRAATIYGPITISSLPIGA